MNFNQFSLKFVWLPWKRNHICVTKTLLETKFAMIIVGMFLLIQLTIFVTVMLYNAVGLKRVMKNAYYFGLLCQKLTYNMQISNMQISLFA